MLKSFYKQYCYINCLVWVSMLFGGQTLFGQITQNPFDIKSRTFIDTSVNAVDTLPVGNKTQSIEAELLHQKSGNQTRSTSPQNNEVKGSQKPHKVLPKRNKDEVISNAETEVSSNEPTTNQSRDEDEFSGMENLKDVFTIGTQTNGPKSWWYYVYDLILLLFLLGAFLYDKKIFQPLRKAFVHENFLRFLYRDTYLRKPGLFIYLNILFLLSLGFIIFRGAQYYGWASTFFDYAIIQGVVLIIFLIKHLALHFLSSIVDKSFELKFYQYWMILSAGLIGLWIIPLALMVSVLPIKYLSIALYVTGSILFILLIYRHFKALMHAKFFLSKHFFQYFLYFCAVEIIPALLLADILIHY